MIYIVVIRITNDGILPNNGTFRRYITPYDAHRRRKKEIHTAREEISKIKATTDPVIVAAIDGGRTRWLKYFWSIIGRKKIIISDLQRLLKELFYHV